MGLDTQQDSPGPRRNDDYKQQFYKPLDSAYYSGVARPHPLLPVDTRPPLPPSGGSGSEILSETDRMRLEYGGDSRAAERSAVELMDEDSDHPSKRVMARD